MSESKVETRPLPLLAGLRMTPADVQAIVKEAIDDNAWNDRIHELASRDYMSDEDAHMLTLLSTPTIMSIVSSMPGDAASVVIKQLWYAIACMFEYGRRSAGGAAGVVHYDPAGDCGCDACQYAKYADAEADLLEMANAPGGTLPN